MGKEYRNSSRTRRVIKKTFLDLLSEKDIGHISIVDIVNAADISRNTFYYHYEDIAALQTEIDTDVYRTYNYYFNHIFENYKKVPLQALFLHVCNVLMGDLEVSSILKSPQTSAECVKQMEQLALKKIEKNMQEIPSENKTEFMAYMEYAVCASFRMLQRYAMGDTNLTMEQIADVMAGSFLAGIQIHKQKK